MQLPAKQSLQGQFGRPCTPSPCPGNSYGVPFPRFPSPRPPFPSEPRRTKPVTAGASPLSLNLECVRRLQQVQHCGTGLAHDWAAGTQGRASLAILAARWHSAAGMARSRTPTLPPMLYFAGWPSPRTTRPTTRAARLTATASRSRKSKGSPPRRGELAAMWCRESARAHVRCAAAVLGHVACVRTSAREWALPRSRTLHIVPVLVSSSPVPPPCTSLPDAAWTPSSCATW